MVSVPKRRGKVLDRRSPEDVTRCLTAQECRERIDSVAAQVTAARALSETARELRQYNAELREILRENRLMSISLIERWMEKVAFDKE